MPLRYPRLNVTESDLIAVRADSQLFEFECPQCGQLNKQSIRQVVMNDYFPCFNCRSGINISSDDWRARIAELVQNLREINLPKEGQST